MKMDLDFYLHFFSDHERVFFFIHADQFYCKSDLKSQDILFLLKYLFVFYFKNILIFFENF